MAEISRCEVTPALTAAAGQAVGIRLIIDLDFSVVDAQSVGIIQPSLPGRHNGKIQIYYQADVYKRQEAERQVRERRGYKKIPLRQDPVKREEDARLHSLLR